MPTITDDQFTDAIVIGTGYGGAVSARRLAEAGETVRMLERGAWWVPPGRPNPPEGSAHAPWQLKDKHLFPTLRNLDARAAWRLRKSPLDGPVHVGTTDRPGMYERVPEHKDSPSHMAVIAAAAVGGGSVANGTMMLRANRQEWAHILPESLVPWAEIDAAYATVKQEIGFRKPGKDDDDDVPHVFDYKAYSDHLTFRQQARIGGYTTRQIHTAVDWERIVELLDAHERGDGAEPWAARGEYLIGSRDDIKLSLDKNYLPAALATGRCRIHALTEVVALRPIEGGWEVQAHTLDEHGARKATVTFRARRVFCCAGSMGTTRLLLRASAAVPALKALLDSGKLGTRWGNNGDVLLRRTGVQVAVAGRTGGPSLFAFEAPATDERPFPLRAVHTPGPDVVDWAFIQLVMGPVAATGTFAYDDSANDWRLLWDAKKSDGDAPSSDQLKAAAYEVVDGLPGFAFAVVGDAAASTFHPLGGCVLGEATDRTGQVIGCPGLYVNDSALIPGHTGSNNPAWTVAALAEVLIERVLAG